MGYLGDEVKLMVKVSYDSEKPLSYTEVKVLWDIVQETLDPRENLSTESSKVIKQDQSKTSMDLPEADRVFSSSYGIPILLQKDSKGFQYGGI